MPRPYGLDIIGSAARYGAGEFLARQLGIPYALVSRPEPSACRVVFAERMPALLCGEMTEFIRQGGVLVTADPWAESFGFRLPSSAEGSAPSPAVAMRAGKGVVIGLDPRLLTGALDGKRTWQLAGYSSEATALIPCAAAVHFRIHALWREALRSAFAHLGLPLMHAWYFPGDARTHVNVRVDADWYDEREWNDTCALLAPLGNSSSWYLTCADLDGKPERLLKLKQSGVEIGSHAYRHYTFRDYPNNIKNMRRADACLRTLGVDLRSFVSPSAKWNHGLQRAVEELGYEYSSEFGFVHDAYPCDPPLGARSSKALQVPVHAVSPINFRKWAPATPVAGIADYYRRTVAALHDACLPVHVYGHPSDLPLLAGGSVIEAMRALPFASVSTLLEYARWWRGRSGPLTISCESRDDGTSVTQSGLPADVRLCVWRNDSELSLVKDSAFVAAKDGTVNGAVTHTVNTSGLPGFRAVTRTLTLRSKVGEWLDYEKVVPSAEHVASSPRTLVNAVVKRMTGL